MSKDKNGQAATPISEQGERWLGYGSNQATDSMTKLHVGTTTSNGVANIDELLLDQLDQADDATEWLNGALDEDQSNAHQHVEHSHSVSATSSSNKGASVGKLLSLESQLSRLSTTLSIAHQDTLSQLDTTMSNVNVAVPRLGVEMRLMREAALTLKTSIARLRSEADSAGLRDDEHEHGDKQTSHAVAVLDRLAALHALHTRMSAARDVLSLAESWSTLSTDVNAYLADAKYDVAAARIARAKTSLSVFERTPEFESRKRLLDGLASSLESRLAPTLIDAIRDRDVGQAKKLVDVLESVGRQSQTKKIWQKTRSEECVSEWERTSEQAAIRPTAGSEDGESIKAASRQLRRFADSFIALLDEERKIVSQVLRDDPRADVEELTSFVLDALQPKLSVRLSTLIPDQRQNSVLYACEVHEALRYTAIGVIASTVKIESLSAGNPSSSNLLSSTTSTPLQQQAPIPQSPEAKNRISALHPAGPSHARRLSVRRASAGTSTNRPGTGGSSELPAGDVSAGSIVNPIDRPSQWDSILALLPKLSAWESKLFEPLLEYQMNYEALEKAFLSPLITFSADPLPVSQNGNGADALLVGSEVASGLKVDIEQALELALQSASRTKSLTYGLGCDGLINSLDDALSSIISHNKVALDQRLTNALNAAQQLASELSNGDGEAKDNSQGLFESSGLASTSARGAEWKAFEEGMGLLANLRAIADDIRKAEFAIADQLVDLADFLLTPVSASSKEIVNRLCTDKFGTYVASFRLLLQASVERLQTGSVMISLQQIRSIATQAQKRNKAYHATPSTLMLFQATQNALLDQMRAIQRHLTNIILSPLMPHLQVYAALPIWAANRLPGSVNEYDLTMPTFSLSPTEDMSRIGEALLDLPRLLEVWSELPQFRWSVHGLAFVSKPKSLELSVDREGESIDLFDNTLTPSPKREKRMSMYGTASVGGGGVAHSGTSPTLERRTLSSTSHRHTPSVASIATLPARGEQTKRQEEQSTDAERVEGTDAQSALQGYLTSISLTLISHLVSLVLPSIAQLTAPGASQLAADLEYLLTILSALNVSQQSGSSDGTEESNDVLVLVRTLEAWKDVCSIKDPEGRRLRHLVRSGQLARATSLGGERVEGFQGDEDRLGSLLGTQAFDMVSRMRGW